MRTSLRVVLGAMVGTVGCVSVAAAQSTGLQMPDILNLVGFGAGSGALIAWGTQKEKVQSHGERLKVLEDDRVTRREFETMGGNLRSVEEMTRQLLDLIERRQRPRDQ